MSQNLPDSRRVSRSPPPGLANMAPREHETDEEKRARRLAKKAAKRAKEAAALGGYTNDANPWNDTGLGEQFVWGKKLERDRKSQNSEANSADAMKRKRAEQLRELKKAKRAREQREKEREAWEAEKILLEREREQMAFVDNEKREQDFQLRQAHMRAHLRTGEGRGKAIDIISETLSILHPGVDLDAAHVIKVEVRAPRHMKPRSCPAVMNIESPTT